MIVIIVIVVVVVAAATAEIFIKKFVTFFSLIIAIRIENVAVQNEIQNKTKNNFRKINCEKKGIETE